jgi:hypothetical protein
MSQPPEHFGSTWPAPTATSTVALARWQSRDGTYRACQRLLRSPLPTGSIGPDLISIAQLVGDISTAIHTSQTTAAARVFRGIRDIDLALGPDLAPGAEHILAGFTATTTDPIITLEFIPKGGAILALDVPRNFPAVDLGTYGDPAFAYQRELLLPDGVHVRVVSHSSGRTISTDPRIADTMVIHAEVLDDRPLL